MRITNIKDCNSSTYLTKFLFWLSFMVIITLKANTEVLYSLVIQHAIIGFSEILVGCIILIGFWSSKNLLKNFLLLITVAFLMAQILSLLFAITVLQSCIYLGCLLIICGFIPFDIIRLLSVIQKYQAITQSWHLQPIAVALYVYLLLVILSSISL